MVSIYLLVMVMLITWESLCNILNMIPLLVVGCKYYRSLCGLSFHSINIYHGTETLDVKVISLIFFLLITAICVQFKDSFIVPKVIKTFSFRNFILPFTFRSVIHQELVFLHGVKQRLYFSFFHIDIHCPSVI